MINYDYCNSNVDMFVDQLSEELNLNPPSDVCTFNKIYNDLLDKNFKLKTPRYSKKFKSYRENLKTSLILLRKHTILEKY